jgi:hypothetical protein
MKRNVILTILVAVLLVAVAAGVGFGAFRAGQAYGISQSPEIATAIANRPEGSAAGAPFVGGPFMMGGPGMMNGNGFGRPFGGGFGPHWGMGFGFLQCLVPLFFFLLVFAIFRLIFRPWGWRGGWGGRWGHGPWGRGGPDGQHAVPPMFEEWHKQAHGQTPPPPTSDTPPSTNA